MRSSGNYLKPPKFAEKLLGLLLVKDEWETPLGDFEEFFNDMVESEGKRRARLWYWQQVFKLIPVKLKNSILWSINMFKNYLKMALRNCIKFKWSSLINILSLTIGVVCSIFIFLYVSEEFSYEGFHKKGDRIYRTLTYVKLNNNKVVTGDLFSEDSVEIIRTISPSIERASSYALSSSIVEVDGNCFNDRFGLVGADFLKIFTFPLVAGTMENVLATPDSLVLTKKAANKYFGRLSEGYAGLLGKTLKVHGNLRERDKNYIITGVLDDLPANSSMKFSFLVNIKNSLRYSKSTSILGDRSLFLLLKDKRDHGSVEKALVQLNSTIYEADIKNYQGKGIISKDDDVITYRLQALGDMYLGEVELSYIRKSSKLYSLILIGIGVLILVLACMNFISLSFGRAIGKVGEIGVRKTLGASKVQIILQHVVDSGFLVVLAICMGVPGTYLLLPFLNNVAQKNLVIGGSNGLFLMFFIFCTMGGFIVFAAGIPALFISKFQPGRILGSLIKPKGKSFVTSILVMVQFIISIVLLICTFTMASQLSYIQEKDLGFDKNNLIVIRTPFSAYEKLKRAFLEHREVVKVGGADRNFSNGTSSRSFRNEKGETVEGYLMKIEEDYLSTMNINLVQGRGFAQKYPGDKKSSIIVNEEMVRRMGWKKPVGQLLKGVTGFKESPMVVGVVEDFNFQSVKKKIQPLILHMNQRFGGFSLMVRVQPGIEVIQKLKKDWERLVSGKPFNYSFMDDDLNNKYLGDARWRDITGFSSLLAFIISALGLVGLVSIMIGYRIKEIGIRKVLGGSVFSIVFKLLKDFTKWVVFANLLAWPIAYNIVKIWLEGFAYRTGIDFSIFLLAGLSALVIAVLAVSFQTINAARINPVESLKSD